MNTEQILPQNLSRLVRILPGAIENMPRSGECSPLLEVVMPSSNWAIEEQTSYLDSLCDRHIAKLRNRN